MKKCCCALVCMILVLSLLSCANKVEEPQWPGYSGTMDGYEFFYPEGRERQWEEDVLFVAEAFLKNHAQLSDSEFFTKIIDLYEGTEKKEYSNIHYNKTLRDEFIAQFNELIPRISELDDIDVRYELSRIIAILKVAHSGVNVVVGSETMLPFGFVPIGKTSDAVLCTVRVTEEYRHLLGSRLIAINGVPVSEVISKMSVYFPTENEYYPIFRLVSQLDYPLLTQFHALRAAGVVDREDTTADLTFETEDGTVTERLEFIPLKEGMKLDKLSHDMITDLSLKNRMEDNFWFVVDADAEVPYLYVRFRTMYPQEIDFNKFYVMLETELKHAQTPLKLIMDFRDNTGGMWDLDPETRFARSVNRYGTNGTYILINGSCFSTGMATPYHLSKAIDGAKLVGSPTGEFINCFSNGPDFETPNFGVSFRVSEFYIRCASGDESDAVYPDITVFQTWEDYQNNVDTVLEYVLSLK